MALQFHKAHLYLEGRVREQPYQVGLGSNLYRHQVEDDDFQRTYVLCTCPRCINNEDISSFSKSMAGNLSGKFSGIETFVFFSHKDKFFLMKNDE